MDRDVARTPQSIYEGELCHNYLQLNTFQDWSKALYLRCMRGFWLHLRWVNTYNGFWLLYDNTRFHYGINHLVRKQNLPRKKNISYPLICKRMYAYQGVRNFTFSENFAYVRMIPMWKANNWPMQYCHRHLNSSPN